MYLWVLIGRKIICGTALLKEGRGGWNAHPKKVNIKTRVVIWIYIILTENLYYEYMPNEKNNSYLLGNELMSMRVGRVEANCFY